MEKNLKLGGNQLFSYFFFTVYVLLTVSTGLDFFSMNLGYKCDV